MEEKKNIFTQLWGVITDFFKFWNKPDPNTTNEVPNKEIVAISGGGMGIKIINGMVTWVQLSATCFLVGSCYGITPTNILWLTIISTIVSVIKTPLASWLVDNTNTKWGKLRPYFLFAGVPALIGVLGICFLVPVDGSQLEKTIWFGLFYIIYTISQQIYNSAYVSLYQVISPNSGERNKIMSISELVANLGPSIIQLFLPIIAGFFTYEGINPETGEVGKLSGMTNLTTYRVALPIFAIIGFVLGIVVMLMTKERAVLPKTAANKVKFTTGLKLVLKNRDMWIVSISRFFGGFRGCLTLLLGWVVVYQLGQTMDAQAADSLLGVFMTIVSIGYTPGMVLAAFFISKLGSKMSAFSSFLLQTIIAVIILITFKFSAYIFVVCLLLYNFAQGPQFIMQTSITADAIDQIQYESGERIEGFVQNFQVMVESIGTLASTLVFTLIYKHFGLEENYDILYSDSIRNPIITWMLVAVVASCVISAVPFLFMQMTKSKHEEIIAALKERAGIEENVSAEEPAVDQFEIVDTISE